METDEVDQYIEQINGLDLPEAIKDSLLDAADTRKQQIENGVHPEPSWGFINVAEAEELFNSVVNFINKADDSKKLTDVITSREYKLKALDFMLKGKKWTFDGLTPYRHIVKLYENKNIQLTEK
jgi:hypothetical protein